MGRRPRHLHPMGIVDHPRRHQHPGPDMARLDRRAAQRPQGQRHRRSTGRWQKLDRTALDPRDLAALEALEKLGGHGEVLGPDGEVRITRPGKKAGVSASIGYLDPGVVKVFTDDWKPLRKGAVYSVDDLEALTPDEGEASTEGAEGYLSQGEITSEPVTLDQCHDVFRRWLGKEYDLDVLNATLCAATVEHLDGDPLWLLIVAGSGNAKTETVNALSTIGANTISTISSDAALLSGTPKRDRAKDATGGLLRKIGPRGLLVIKDVTSILSNSRETRGMILSALREIHDGRWSRDMGGEGGRSLVWEGRLVVIGAVTTAWDQAHTVIATMGDRFALIRSSSTTGRSAARRKAIGNTGSENTMRAELGAAAAGVMAGVDTTRDLTSPTTRPN